MAEPLRRRRNYGTRGCLLTIAALAAVLLAIELVIGWADRNPNNERIQAATNDMVRRQLIDLPVMALTVAAIHPRKTRFTLGTERWSVQGEVILAGDGGRVPYLALIHLTCDDAYDRACWTLEQLTYDSRILRLVGRAGSVIN